MFSGCKFVSTSCDKPEYKNVIVSVILNLLILIPELMCTMFQNINRAPAGNSGICGCHSWEGMI